MTLRKASQVGTEIKKIDYDVGTSDENVLLPCAREFAKVTCTEIWWNVNKRIIDWSSE